MFSPSRVLSNFINLGHRRLKKRTNKRSDDEKDVNSKAAASRNDEMRNLMNGDDDGADGDGEKQLKSDDGVDFTNE